MNQSKINEFFFGKKHSFVNETMEHDNGLETLETLGNLGNQKDYVLFFDGCSKGNPGVAGAGACLCENENEIWFQTMFVGDHETNNVAEYCGLIIGLEEAVRRNIQEITIKGDSELIIKQMRGEYKVKAPNLKELHKKATELSRKIPKTTFLHIYRHFNQRADELSNEALIKS